MHHGHDHHQTLPIPSTQRASFRHAEQIQLAKVTPHCTLTHNAFKSTTSTATSDHSTPLSCISARSLHCPEPPPQSHICEHSPYGPSIAHTDRTASQSCSQPSARPALALLPASHSARPVGYQVCLVGLHQAGIPCKVNSGQ